MAAAQRVKSFALATGMLSVLLTGCSEKVANSTDNAVVEKVTASSLDSVAAYTSCASCHGKGAEGNPALNAPSLRNLDAVYIARQLTHFRDGIRGTNPQDTHGAVMVGMSSALDDNTIEQLAQAIAAEDDHLYSGDVAGNPRTGKGFYDHQCGACHGPAGEGNALFSAPKLAGLDPWYVERQLHNFAAGIRGSHEKDTYGKQMVFIMSRMKDPEEMTHILAYIANPQ